MGGLAVDAYLGLITVLGIAIQVCEGIGCFICNSYNGSDDRCDDPFSSTPHTYHRECMQGMPGRQGLYPARYCIKMNGISLSSGAQITVRRCSIMSMSYQCGIFQFDSQKFQGCLTTCHRNGCNHGNSIHRSSSSSRRWSVLLYVGFVLGLQAVVTRWWGPSFRVVL